MPYFVSIQRRQPSIPHLPPHLRAVDAAPNRLTAGSTNDSTADDVEGIRRGRDGGAPPPAAPAPPRYRPGVIPVIRRHVVVKWLVVRNPTSRAISAIGTVPADSNARASSIRRRTTKRCGGTPVLRLKSRAKW